MDDIIKLHVECKGNQKTEAVGISKDTDWSQIRSLVQAIAQCSEFDVKYLDDDNELIALASDIELSEAFRVARKQKNCLYVKVFPLNISALAESLASTKPESLQSLSSRLVPETALQNYALAQKQVERNEKVEDKESPQVRAKAKESKSNKKPSSIVKKFFFIRHIASGLVLDVGNWLSEPGTAVIMFTKKKVGSGQCGNQLWYTDSKTSTIRSKFCNLYLTARDSGLCVMPFEPDNDMQKWTLLDGRLRPCSREELTLVPHQLKDYSPVTLRSVPQDECPLWEFRYRHDELVAKKQAAKASRDCLDRIASGGSQSDCGKCKQERKVVKRQESDDAPKWFSSYMDKFKKDVVEQTSSKISQRTVSKVLRGLEGAVITSVEESGRVSGAITAPGTPTALGPEKNFSTHAHGQFCHTGIICDLCEKVIVGPRYKCGNCADFDLCAACEAKPHNHLDDHVFVKIIRPVRLAGRTSGGKFVPLLAHNLYNRESEQLRKQMEKLKACDSESSASPVRTKKVEKLRKKAEKLSTKHERIRCKEERLKRRIEQERELPLQKKEKLALPQYHTPDQMDAQFSRHENIVDGTSVQRGVEFVKTWVIRNTGKVPWAAGVTLQMLRSDMAAVKTEYPVPHAEPDQEVSVSVELIAPSEQGVFQSHWQLNYCGIFFGKCIWCSVVVDAPTEPSQPTTDVTAEADVTRPNVDDGDVLWTEKPDMKELQSFSLPVDECEAEEPAADDDVMPSLAAEELSFELLETTRANFEAAPLLQPPSVVENPTEPRHATDDVQAAIDAVSMQDLLSTSESESDDDGRDSDSDSDFIVVPIPDCFVPNLPSARTASTSVYVNKELDATARQGSVRASEWEPLLQVSQTQTEEELVASLADARESSAATADERAPLLCHLEDALNKVNITQDVDADPQSEENNEQVRDAGADTDDDDFAFRDCSAAPIDDVTRVAVENQEVKQAAEHDDVCDDVDDVTAAKTRARREEEAVGASEEVVASANCEEAKPTFDVFDPFTDAGDHKRKPKQDVVAHVVDIATNAGTKVYHMAKDVFQTLQAKNNYEPPQSAWSPPPSQWTPTPSEWKPSAVQWVPGEARVVGQEPAPSAPDVQLLTQDDAMRRLVEMGFANRSLNKRLLDEHDDDLATVVRELLAQDDSNWHVTRH